MRRFSFFTLLCLFFLFVFVACTRENELNVESAPNGGDVEFVNTPEGFLQIMVPAIGGTASVAISASSDWFASFFNQNAVTWCHLSVKEGSKGDSLLSISVDENKSYSERNASIVISSEERQQTVVITQKQVDAVLLSSDKVNVSSDTEIISITVQHNVDFTCEVGLDCKNWITNLSTKSLNKDEFLFQVRENRDTNRREGTIIFRSDVGSETVHVYQDGFVPTLLLGQDVFNVDYTEQFFSVEIKSNVDFEFEIDEDTEWIHYNETKSVSTHTLVFSVERNEDIKDREGTISFINQDNGLLETVKVFQGWDEQGYIEIERQALVALYQSTNGGSWTTPLSWSGSTDNWCSDEPIGSWRGVTVNEKGHVVGIKLSSSNMTGHLPPELGNLLFLEEFDVYYNHIGGEIPKEIGNCKQLKALDLRHNEFQGYIPSSIGELTYLEYWNFAENSFTGPLPESIKNNPLYKQMWADIYVSNNIPIDLNDIPVPEFDVIDLDGNTLNSKTVYAENKYTVLIQVLGICIDIFEGYLPQLKDLYQSHKSDGIEFIFYSWESVQDLKDKYNLPWKCFQYEQDINFIGGRTQWSDSEKGMGYPYWGCIIATVIKEGKEVAFVNLTKQSFGRLFDYFNKEFYGTENNVYHSTDFSADGKTVMIQNATEGNGINLVLMGDGFSDRMIKNGTYDAVMKTVCEDFFSVEPYSTFRNLFNVTYVASVSKDEGVSIGTETKFGSIFTADNGIDINLYECEKSAVQVVPRSEIDHTLVIMCIYTPDSMIYRGRCFMLYPTTGTDFGDGFSVACITWDGTYPDSFAEVVHHEACGHGFAKLGDEYYYEGQGTIPDSEIKTINSYVLNGWWKNIDFTDDITTVKWSKFLMMNDYRTEKLGCYEGGFHFEKGVWRPSEYSIMRYNTGGFNAPSREAIWYRIHKLAYGADWQYNFDDFIRYDKKNIKNQSSTVASPKAVQQKYKHYKPAIIKDASNISQIKEYNSSFNMRMVPK